MGGARWRLTEGIGLVDLVVALGLADKVNQRLAQLRVDVPDDVELLGVGETLEECVTHLG